MRGRGNRGACNERPRFSCKPKTCGHAISFSCRSVGFHDARNKAATPGRIAPIVFAFLIARLHQPITETPGIAEAENCNNNTGLCAHGPRPAAPRRPRRPVDPCFVALSTNRPCTSAQRQPPKPVGVDPHTVGTWELSVNNSRWVWEIDRKGTYRFHTEGAGVAVSHAGTFSASNGQWALKATTGYADSGTYLFQPPDTLIATGQLGTAAWHLPCAEDCFEQAC